MTIDELQKECERTKQECDRKWKAYREADDGHANPKDLVYCENAYWKAYWKHIKTVRKLEEKTTATKKEN